MRATDGFDMTAVAERAAVVQASLFDDVVRVVNELGPAILTRLNIAGGHRCSGWSTRHACPAVPSTW